MAFLPQLRPLIHLMCLPSGPRHYSVMCFKKKKTFPAASGSVQSTHWASFCAGLPVGPGVFLVHDQFPKLREVMDCCSRSLWAFSGDRLGCLAVLNGSSDRPELTCSRQHRLLVVSSALMKTSRLQAWVEGRGGGEKIKGEKGEADDLPYLKAVALTWTRHKELRSATLLNELASFPLTL